MEYPPGEIRTTRVCQVGNSEKLLYAEVAQMVERWLPKPKVRGFEPRFPLKGLRRP